MINNTQQAQNYQAGTITPATPILGRATDTTNHGAAHTHRTGIIESRPVYDELAQKLTQILWPSSVNKIQFPSELNQALNL